MKGLDRNLLPNVRNARCISGKSPDRTFRRIRKIAGARAHATRLVPLALQRRSFTPLYPSASSHACPHLETTLFASAAVAAERPRTPFNPFHFGNLIHGLSAILPHPSRSMLVKRWARVRARALCVRCPLSSPLFSSITLSLSPSVSFSLPLFLASFRFSQRITPSLSCCCTDSRGWR